MLLGLLFKQMPFTCQVACLHSQMITTSLLFIVVRLVEDEMLIVYTA